MVQFYLELNAVYGYRALLKKSKHSGGGCKTIVTGRKKGAMYFALRGCLWLRAIHLRESSL